MSDLGVVRIMWRCRHRTEKVSITGSLLDTQTELSNHLHAIFSLVLHHYVRTSIFVPFGKVLVLTLGYESTTIFGFLLKSPRKNAMPSYVNMLEVLVAPHRGRAPSAVTVLSMRKTMSHSPLQIRRL